MREVLGDAEPYDDAIFDQRTDPYDGDDIDDITGPGALLRSITRVATPEALTLGAAVLACASLFSLPASGVASRAFTNIFDTSIADRAEGISHVIVAVLAGLLALLARRNRYSDAGERPAWVLHLSGGALVVAAISAILMIGAMVVSGARHHNPADFLRVPPGISSFSPDGTTSGQDSSNIESPQPVVTPSVPDGLNFPQPFTSNGPEGPVTIYPAPVFSATP